jgi:hypothetical protein
MENGTLFMVDANEFIHPMIRLIRGARIFEEMIETGHRHKIISSTSTVLDNGTMIILFNNEYVENF